MASKIILHIGLQKSGTTFLQHMLYDNRDVLAEAGFCYPVSLDWGKGKRTVPNHEWSSYGLLGTEFPWVSKRRAANKAAAWQALADQVATWPGTVLLSAEALSVIRAPAIGRLLDALGCDDVEVLVTARSLGRSLPSLWQQHVRNGKYTGFERYLESLAEWRERGPDYIESDPDSHLWRAFVLSGLVRRWSAAGVNRVRAVTTPGRPPEVLWHRFVEALGLPQLAQAEPTQEWHRAHAGLTAPETLVLASLNRLLNENRWKQRDADRLRDAVTERFQTREERGGKIVIPPEWRPTVAEWNREDLSALSGMGAEILGDIADLRYDPDGESGSAPTAEETGRAGADALFAAVGLRLNEPAPKRKVRAVRRILP
ncbi:hypothetical protein Acsp03_04040 [Actinomadura sp. NBRC 104412]|uniref:hypothetical protein n=1 Tax=Actinomadura sp. NBRC 104412 TaxID=3032203 RepID=UPI0024A2662E|nr:hypothetical protein [Actinomadura sp. NBRC 104412]GLZ02937.1 hypothetical protein Acsp03_04040 [Actinomadura sp. NBRC 104412]